MVYDLAFYTYFFGGNNNPAFKVPNAPSSDKYKCYYYTNNKTILEMIQNTKWIGIYVNMQNDDDVIGSNMFGKHLKSSPHEYKELKNYSYLCFLDSKLEHVNETFVEQFIVKYFIKQNYALLLREHPFIRNNVWTEYGISMEQEGEKYKQYIYKQINNGLSNVTPHHCATGFLIRNMKHEKLIELNNTWYTHILECGIQCQISFFFVKQLFEGCIYSFTEIPFIL